MSIKNLLVPEYPVDCDITLDPQETWPRSVHRFEADRRAVTALRAAEACGRPLLVRGSPGVGKSQLARAAAQEGKRPFVSAVIDSRTQAHDLMWRLDAVRRLGDAQVLQGGQTLRPESDYIEPQALWWALDWKTAAERTDHYRKAAGLEAAKRVVPKDWQPDNGRAPVLLLDEIDKADPDLPNALLEVLANGGFRLPFAGEAVKADYRRRPLVIITTNEERELPQAFLRRCLILTLELPKTENEFVQYMVAMGLRHQPLWQGNCLVMEQAAQRLWGRRVEAQRRQDYQPGTAEYLDLVSALANLWPGQAAEQERQLDLLAQFTFHKTQAAPR
ncbi:MAG: hypothetical protein RLY71_1806 [Pseudomonadota bacterium]|jgi:MoxR-like ATPase